MKANGQKLYIPFEKVIVIPRGTIEEHIAFTARSVDCRETFDEMCPKPSPPEVTKAGGEKFLDYKDKKFQKEIEDVARLYFDYMVVSSLKLPEGWEWETVDLLDKETWPNWRKELKDSGFSDPEIVRISDGVLTVNNLNSEAITQAEKDFLALQHQKDESQ